MTPAERFEILSKKYYFDEDAALEKKQFIESKCSHVKGALSGKPFVISDWQYEDIIKPVFGLRVCKGGRRLIRHVYMELPRKNGKTTLMGGVELALLFNDGEPGAEVYNCAGDDEQAGLLFKIVKEMVANDDELSAVSKSYINTIVYGNSFIKKITSKSDTKHGFNSHGVIYDELHVAPNRNLYDILKTSIGARMNPLMISITTAGIDTTSICYIQHEKVLKLLEGSAEDDNYWGIIYAASMDDDISKKETWRKANPLYDESEELRIFLGEMYNTISTEPSFESTFRRLCLNQWVGTIETWIADEVWMNNSEEPVCSGPCFAGLDLATVNDVCAFVLFFPETYSVLPFFFVPKDNIEERSRKEGINYNLWTDEGLMIATPGNIVDYSYVASTIIEARNTYDIQSIGYDRHRMEDLANKFDQQDMDLSTWPIVPVGQGYLSFSEPVKNIERFTIAGKFRHGGNPVLRWMISNVVIDQDPAGNYKLNRAKAKEKIDGIAALADALYAWSNFEQPFRSRYEDNPEFDTIQL